VCGSGPLFITRGVSLLLMVAPMRSPRASYFAHDTINGSRARLPLAWRWWFVFRRVV